MSTIQAPEDYIEWVKRDLLPTEQLVEWADLLTQQLNSNTDVIQGLIDGDYLLNTTDTFTGVLTILGSATATAGFNALSTTTGIVNVASATAPTTGQALTATSSSTANWQDVGDVSKVGTPAVDQVGYWTGDGTLAGDANFTFDPIAVQLAILGSISAQALYLEEAAAALADVAGSGQFWVNNTLTPHQPYFTTDTGVEYNLAHTQISGTPVEDQLAVWTSADTIEGEPGLVYNNTTGLFTVSGVNGLLVTNTNGIMSIRDNNEVSPLGTPRLEFQSSGGTKGRVGFFTSDIDIELTSYLGEVFLYPAETSGTQAVRIVQGGLVMIERADHAVTPIATAGEFWIRQDSPNVPMFTDDAGGDWILNSGGGDVSKVGTPVNNQLGVWTGDGTIEGDAGLTFDGTDLTTTGAILATGGVDKLTTATAAVSVAAATAPTIGQVLTATAATTATWQSAAGGGNVSNTGTPVNNQLAVWTASTIIEGDADLTFDGVDLTTTGAVLATGGIDKLTTATGAVSVAAATAPTNGQVLTATSATVATWQAAGGGGSGIVVQQVHMSDSAVATGGTIFPWDNSIPQNTEGDEYMTLAITPGSASNLLKIEVYAFVTNLLGNVWAAIALFQDTTAGALAATGNYNPVGTEGEMIYITYWMTAGTTSATTFKVRAGGNLSTTTTFNGQNGVRMLGGVMASGMTISEYTP